MRSRIKKGDETAAKEPPDNDVPDVSAVIHTVQPVRTTSKLSHIFKKLASVLKYSLIVLIIPAVLNYGSLLRESAVLIPQGALYDVGFGQKIFMTCNGTGTPIVILDAPTGMSSDVWTPVFQGISETTRVCMYDRAGLGFSERHREVIRNQTQVDQNERNRWQPYTVERMVDDLHRLITFSSQQQRPLILVGAEMGALVARFFAQIYEGDVSDVVLIEPLPEDLFSYESNVWVRYWSEHLIAQYQTMQLSAAVGLTRLVLMVGATDFPMSDAADKLPLDVINRQKHLLCNPRHLSSIVDEHFFINETFSQMQTVFRMKAFPKNIRVTVISADHHDDLLPSELNKAWAKSQQNFMSKLHDNSRHVVVQNADRKMLYRRPAAIVKPIKELIQQWRTRPQPS